MGRTPGGGGIGRPDADTGRVASGVAAPAEGTGPADAGPPCCAAAGAGRGAGAPGGGPAGRGGSGRAATELGRPGSVGDGRVLWILRGSSCSTAATWGGPLLAGAPVATDTTGVTDTTGATDITGVATRGCATGAATAGSGRDGSAATGVGAAASTARAAAATGSTAAGRAAAGVTAAVVTAAVVAAAVTAAVVAAAGVTAAGASTAATVAGASASGTALSADVGAGAGLAADAVFFTGFDAAAAPSSTPSTGASAGFLAARFVALCSSGCSGRVRPSRSARRRRRSACASMMVEDWLFASTPIAPVSASISVFVIPSSFASSCTRMFFAKTRSAFHRRRRDGTCPDNRPLFHFYGGGFEFVHKLGTCRSERAVHNRTSPSSSEP